MQEREVEALLERVLDGEPDRFAPIVEAYTPGLYNLACKMLGGSPEATDVVQETFFRAYRDLGRFDGRTRFYSWLCGICVNVCYDTGKRRKRAWEREQPLPEEGADRLAVDGPDAEAALMAAQDEAGVRRCLGRLPDTLRAALLLRYQEDLSLQEVADQLRIGLSAAKMRVQRGLALLKDCMSARLAGGAP